MLISATCRIILVLSTEEGLSPKEKHLAVGKVSEVARAARGVVPGPAVDGGTNGVIATISESS